MLHPKNAIFIVSLLVLFLPAKPAQATALTAFGVPVAAFGETTPVTTLNENNFIEYFIPLEDSASGVFGVNGFGTSSDQGSGGGEITIFLAFDLSQFSAQEELSLLITFDDLDLFGVNDPSNLNESVELFNALGDSTGPITSITTSGEQFELTGNAEQQSILFSDAFSILSAPVGALTYLGLSFTSSFSTVGFNTPEYLQASVFSANTAETPEPATLALLASGLLLGRFRRKSL